MFMVVLVLSLVSLVSSVGSSYLHVGHVLRSATQGKMLRDTGARVVFDPMFGVFIIFSEILLEAFRACKPLAKSKKRQYVQPHADNEI